MRYIHFDDKLFVQNEHTGTYLESFYLMTLKKTMVKLF